MIEVKDEILSGAPRYRIIDENGNVINNNVSIEMITPLQQRGTPLNKALFDNLQNDISDMVDTKATFLLGEVEATSNCQELSITGLTIGIGEELVIVFRQSNKSGGVGSGYGHTIHINDSTVYSRAGQYSSSIISARLVRINDINYITSTVGGGGSDDKSIQTTAEEINTITVRGMDNSTILKGCSLLVFKRTL